VLPGSLAALLLLGLAMVALYAAMVWLAEGPRLRTDVGHLMAPEA